MSLRSLATAPAGSRAADAMGDVCDAVARKLDALLFAPLAARRARRSCSCRPARCTRCRGRCCPSLEHRPLAVAPSLRLWHRAATTPPPASRQQVLVAGPRLPGRDRGDRDARAAPSRGAHADRRATRRSRNVARALDGADSVHVAAHGRFRDDNPLFMQPRARRRARHRLRPRAAAARCRAGSCSRAASPACPRSHAGDELMGFTAAVFALGTQTVIAAVVPVPDETTKGLMLALDDELTPRHAARRRRSSTRAPRSPATTAAAPSRAPRSSASAPADYPGTSEGQAAPLDGRARPDRRGGAVLRADDPGVRRQAVPDPVGLDAARRSSPASGSSSTASRTTSAATRSSAT